MSIDPLQLSSVGPTSDAPLILDGGVDGITPTLTGRMKLATIDGNPNQLAEVAFSACKDPAGVYQCHDDGSGPYGDGIQNVHFHVTNSLIGQDLKGVILKIPPSPAGTNDHVYFISRQDKYTGNGNFYGE